MSYPTNSASLTTGSSGGAEDKANRVANNAASLGDESPKFPALPNECGFVKNNGALITQMARAAVSLTRLFARKDDAVREISVSGKVIRGQAEKGDAFPFFSTTWGVDTQLELVNKALAGELAEYPGVFAAERRAIDIHCYPSAYSVKLLGEVGDNPQEHIATAVCVPELWADKHKPEVFFLAPGSGSGRWYNAFDGAGGILSQTIADGENGAAGIRDLLDEARQSADNAESGDPESAQHDAGEAREKLEEIQQLSVYETLPGDFRRAVDKAANEAEESEEYYREAAEKAEEGGGAAYEAKNACDEAIEELPSDDDLQEGARRAFAGLKTARVAPEILALEAEEKKAAAEAASKQEAGNE